MEGFVQRFDDSGRHGLHVREFDGTGEEHCELVAPDTCQYVMRPH